MTSESTVEVSSSLTFVGGALPPAVCGGCGSVAEKGGGDVGVRPDRGLDIELR